MSGTDTDNSTPEGLWESLSSLAFLGTQRGVATLRAFSGTLGEDALADAVRRTLSRSETPEHGLLLSAAVVTHYRRTGRLPDTREPVGSSQSEDPAGRTEASTAATQMLDLLLSGTATSAEHRNGLIALWVQRCAVTGHHVLHRQLPALLAYATGHRNISSEFGEDLANAAGTRGQLLAESNPEWNWLIRDKRTLDTVLAEPAISAEVFDVAPSQIRVELLRGWRGQDPAAALAALRSGWAQNKAEERAAIVRALTTRLGPDDEPFLESCLDDRSTMVRAEAAELLSRLPSSHFSTRMAERANSLVKVTTSGILGRTTVDIEAPESTTIDASWERDGLLFGAPKQGVGKRAWALFRLVELTQLGVWTDATNLRPADLIAATESVLYRQEMLRGWVSAAVRQQDCEWANSLWIATSSRQCIPVMSVADLERRIDQELSRNSAESAARVAVLINDAGERLSSVTLPTVVDWVISRGADESIPIEALVSNASAAQITRVIEVLGPDDSRRTRLRHLQTAQTIREAILKEFP